MGGRLIILLCSNLYGIIMSKKKIKTIILAILLVLTCYITPIQAKVFKIADYNVENLFDLTRSGTEYREYIPNTRYGWTKRIANIKYTNITRVIKNLGADVVTLEEVESRKALISLRDKLRDSGVDYPYLAIADSRPTTVKCALLSKFPIIKKKELRPDDEIARCILEVTLNIQGRHLIVFVNHWKSKHGPESMRIVYAKRLRREIDRLKANTDFILVGDFNSNYNEYKTFLNSRKLNNTHGITGINNILGTIKDHKMVDEKTLIHQTSNRYLYNLWLEVSEGRRWSYIFSCNRESPDNMILSKGLYDNKGISYVDNSFDKFAPHYLFRGNLIYSWQRTSHGRHEGRGYSDHLPIFAYFSTEPFHFRDRGNISPKSTNLKQEKTRPLHISFDLNSASRQELMSIKGIGPALSSRIIAGRPYKTIDNLCRVKGIGPKSLKRLRPYFVINP